VIPLRINKKLVFTLCFKCAEEENQLELCKHEDSERALTGEWVTLEVYKAISKGYKFVKIHEVWHWDQTEQYDRDTKCGGLFTSYINMALKLKQESSGYPSSIQTDDQKENYIRDYYNHEGIMLNKENIQKNSGKRMISKLIANSQWGYLAMNTNKVQHKLVRDVSEWNKMLNDDEIVIHNAELFEADVPSLQVNYTFNEYFKSADTKTNVVLGAFVSCQGRLKLYEELERLGDRVLFFDTD
jgi:hypothetical protein